MKRTCLLFVVSYLSFNLFCQVQWTKYPDNPVMLPGQTGEWEQGFVGPETMLYFDNTYHMWYTGGTMLENTQIGYATSTDGINWTKSQNNPVLTVGPEGAWDDGYILGCEVLFMDSIFHMWYTGHTRSNHNANYRIGHATSIDGIHWEKDSNNPVFEHGPSDEWDMLWVVLGSLIHSGDNFHLFYISGDAYTLEHMGHATSPDGINWTRDPQNPVISPTVDWEDAKVLPASAMYDGSTFQLWYLGGESFYSRIGYATSEDGSSWSKYDNNPVIKNSSQGEWDEVAVLHCTVLDSAGVKYKMWYGGTDATGIGSIGYAESMHETQVEDHTTPGIFIYPNPSNSFLTIETGYPITSNIEITSLNGQLILNKEMNGTTDQIDLSSFQKGFYFITIRSKDFVATKKIIKL